MTSTVNRRLSATEELQLREVWTGLTGSPRTISSKYFYDHRGSELFEQITQLPEYYPTNAERALLAETAPQLVAQVHPQSLIELGAGNSDKTRLLIAAMLQDGGRTYVPTDVSGEFLARSADQLRDEYPELVVVPVVADFTRHLALPEGLPGPALFAFLGSTIGNFEPPEAVALLRRIRRAMAPDDRLLLGADLRKDIGVIEAAYNDSAGVTAEFNRNILQVLNDRFGTDFEPAAFRHRAWYDEAHHRIEMQLIPPSAQSVLVPGKGRIDIAADEPIRTEISTKYDRPLIEQLFRDAGLALVDWEAGDQQLFALALGAPS